MEINIELPLIPVRMLNEFTYCPRLMYIEWVQGEWRDNYETVDGRFTHRRVDTPQRTAQVPQEDAWRTRSVTLSSDSLGLIAKLDLLEGGAGFVSPVEYKRGKTPGNPHQAYDPERVQVVAQALILRDQGFDVDMGYLYFAGSHERVPVALDPDIVDFTHQQIAAMRGAAGLDHAPPVLQDSPKCPKCSLVGICLPEETALVQADAAGAAKPIRRLIPSMDIKVPVYLTQQGTSLGKSGERLIVREHGSTLQEIKMMDIGHVAVFGNVQVSTQAIQALCSQEIPITYFSSGGWFYGVTQSHGHKNILLRQAQYRIADDQKRSLKLAQQLVIGKIANSRTILRRNAKNVDDQLSALKRLGIKAASSSSIESLLGIEGAAAATYFSQFSMVFKEKAQFDWRNRNRRPPLDPVNAMLSLGYALLAKVFTVTCQSVGLDPYLGFYHQPKYGKPALALDLMEEFRPIIVDSVVLTAINTGELTEDDFISRLGSVALTERGRKTFIGAFERRMSTEITHPLFGYKVSYRRIIEVQTRLLGRFLLGEINHYVPFRTR